MRPAQDVAPVNTRRLWDHGSPNHRRGSGVEKVETAMWAGGVVVGGVGAKHALQMPVARVPAASRRHSLRADRTQRSAKAFARGARRASRRPSRPAQRKTSSNGPQNLASRSWMANPTSRAAHRSPDREPADVIQTAHGRWVTPRTCTRREQARRRTARQGLQPEGLDGEEVHGQDRVRLRAQERTPGGAATARRWP